MPSIQFLGHVVKRALQLVALIVAGVAFAAGVGLVAESRLAASAPAPRWVAAIFFTAIVFAFLSWRFRTNWSRGRFWLLLLGAFSLHALAWFIALKQFENWPLAWPALVATAEIPFLAALLIQSGFPPVPS